MSGNYQGGAKKDFKADPIKGYLSARSMSVAYAKDLCIAGKIELSQIPDYADRMTVLQYGQMSVDQRVDAEIMRIAARIKDRLEKQEKHGQPDDDAPESMCDSCANREQNCTQPGTGGEFVECAGFYDVQDAEADAELKRQQQEEDDQRAEAEEQEKQNAQQQEAESQEPAQYQCGTCKKTYKTMKGLERHNKSVHEVP